MSQTFVETWFGIAHEIGRSERWCRYMVRREEDPLPVRKLGGIVRIDKEALEAWVRRQTGSTKIAKMSRPPPEGSGICVKCGDRIPLRADGALKAHEVERHNKIRRCVGAGRYPKAGTVEAPVAKAMPSVAEMTVVGQPAGRPGDGEDLSRSDQHYYDEDYVKRSTHQPHLVGTSAGCPCDECWDAEMRRG